MSSSKTLVIGILVLLPFLFSGCQAAPGSSQSTTIPAQGQPVSGTQVTIAQNAFSPADLQVKVGQKVTWVNQESYPHSVVSDDGSFNSTSLDSGKSFSFTFSKAGTYTYHCSIHPFMTAKVTVTQ